jgi:hypothetical protein
MELLVSYFNSRKDINLDSQNAVSKPKLDVPWNATEIISNFLQEMCSFLVSNFYIWNFSSKTKIMG